MDGFDMMATAKAYADQKDNIRKIVYYRVTDRSHKVHERPVLRNMNQLDGQFAPVMVQQAVGLFPIEAQRRSAPTVITGESSCWFHRSTSPDVVLATSDPKEALWCEQKDKAAIVPSYISYMTSATGKLSTDIFLYRIPQNFPFVHVADIILFQALVHELSHRLAMAAWADASGILEYPHGDCIGCEQAVVRIGKIAETVRKRGISHYSKSYWPSKKRLFLTEEDTPNAKFQAPLHEEVAELITAYLLGFAYTGPISGIDFLPLQSRRDVALHNEIHSFLHATKRVGN